MLTLIAGYCEEMDAFGICPRSISERAQGPIATTRTYAGAVHARWNRICLATRLVPRLYEMFECILRLDGPCD
jgi:hypothetical protein